MKRQALIVVDVQNDFCPGGTLPVPKGDEIIKPLNSVISAFTKEKLPIFMTRDWHPSNHCSFTSQGGPWPPHCVQGTKGAEFHPALLRPAEAVIVSKATEPNKEAYSGFQGTTLARKLRRLRVESLIVGGLATDYCVKNTVIDGLRNGFEVTVLSDCIRGVDVREGDSARALKEMESLGAKLSTSTKVLKFIVGA